MMTPPERPRRLVVGITGASGSVFGIRLLQALGETDIESHLVMSKWGARTVTHETAYSTADVQALATHAYAPGDQGAAVSSGSFITDGMIIAPCSMRSVGAIATGQGDHLVHRAADVVLKERRPLVLVARETPLSEIHLENMLRLARMGAVVIFPPVPAFYNHPRTIEELVDHTVGRVLDQVGVHLDLMPRWDGRMLLASSDRRSTGDRPQAAETVGE